MPKPVDHSHICDRDRRQPLYDARGIFCTYVCHICEAHKRDQFRPEIFSDPDYWTDEPVEESA
jgi:hypothetical protein